MIELSEIRKARSRIKPFIHRTPVLTSLSLNKIIDSELYFKCENFQKSGSFKIRGAANTVLQLNSQELEKGVVTASSGNHGAALSMVVSRLGISSIVVMPNNTPKVKVDNVIRNGGKVVWCEPNQVSREKILDDIIKQTNSILVHPYNDKRIIEGQGTVTLEFLEQCPDLETIISPVSGGGLLSGTICSVKNLNKTIKIYGAEPKEADDTFRSIKSGTIQVNQSTNTCLLYTSPSPRDS